jgi:hypothetical protein
VSHVDRWEALSRRIKAMVAAGNPAIERADALGSLTLVKDRSNQIIEAIREFRVSAGPALTIGATEYIDAFLGEIERVLRAFNEGGGTPDWRRQLLSSILTRFQLFDGELAYYLYDSEVLIRARSELAFVHLQRLIAADSEIRKKWQKAFRQEREEQCEALGAAHLLSHGIWAFKAHAAGGRTDLVFQEPLDLAKAERVADGLVLTEWKKATSREQAEKRFSEARDQARRYVGGIGVFAGNELRHYRYAVVVTEQEMPVPNDWQDSTSKVVYRHVNIATKPRTPSKAKS